MAGQSRKWMILVATIWIQAFTGTNFDFSAYSSNLKSVLGVSQVQLNYLAVASDLGKAFGWSSGLALLCLPLPVVLFIAAFMGIVGYGLQWLVLQNLLSLPYFMVFFLCLIAGCSICWFNTVCFVLCIRNFSVNRALALSLTVSYNGVSPALYTLLARAVPLDSNALYLLLNALVPLVVSVIVLLPILCQPDLQHPVSQDEARRDSLVFLLLYVLALLAGIYLLVLNTLAPGLTVARLLFVGALLMLSFPLFIPGVIYAREWANRTIYSSLRLQGSGFNLVDVEDLELHKELVGKENGGAGMKKGSKDSGGGFCENMLEGDKLSVLGEEHSAKMLVRRLDFWLYYLAYFCGGTVGLVYSNNLGQIAQSLGYAADTEALVTLYSACSFFGRLLSAAPDFLREKVFSARSGWLAIALAPMPVAFFLLATTTDEKAFQIGTGLVGLSSGFIFAAAVSITSELFGPNSFGVNHNILITNIPLGSLVYGSLAALIYDANGSSSGRHNTVLVEGAIVCMGRQCYKETFLWWGCICVVGVASSLALFFRTRPIYNRFEAAKVLSNMNN
ncbi:protein NUCLEAR FUSION DEFECTIVE 4-like isoform X2 [Aristolochia californica]|uniref:protein NUCLEAR FUSION DEFECTIVE 4-like isoform X2 n=1 Tax=Aristolochia californica TaxID=171875 RepID=UPI0035E14639